MKKQITNYTFDKTNKKIIFNEYPSILLESVLLITNVSSNVIIYNFADNAKGGTINGNVLTLIYDTSAMNNTDRLQIFYDDPDVISVQDFVNAMKLIQQTIANPPTTDKTLNQVRTAPQSLPTLANVTTVATVTTVTTVTGMTNIDGLQGKLLINGQNLAAWYLTNRTLIS